LSEYGSADKKIKKRNHKHIDLYCALLGQLNKWRALLNLDEPSDYGT
jgi:hypothetical protein